MSSQDIKVLRPFGPTIAKVKIPDNFVLMGRVLISIGGLLKQYQVKVDLQELALYLMMEVAKKAS